MRQLLVFVLFSQVIHGYSQDPLFFDNHSGINAGLSLSFGSHLNRTGLFISGYHFQDHVQINTVLGVAFNFRHLGPTGRGWEKKLSIGIVYGFDDYKSTNPFHHAVSNQMPWRYSLGYAYNFYWDDWKTTQRTGTVGFNIEKFELIHENDALGAKSDRYRTAAILLAYRNGANRFAVNTTLWTGNANSPQVRKILESNFTRFGYKDLSQAEHGKLSHGLFSAQWERAFDYGQVARLNAGIDAEKVRNILQNKIMHDMYFWPAKWNTAKNPHIPMLDVKGNPFIYKEGQRLKESVFYYELGLNDLTFY